jgi:hypothetical protein
LALQSRCEEGMVHYRHRNCLLVSQPSKEVDRSAAWWAYIFVFISNVANKNKKRRNNREALQGYSATNKLPYLHFSGYRGHPSCPVLMSSLVQGNSR